MSEEYADLQESHCKMSNWNCLKNMGGLQFPYQPGNVGYNKQGKSVRRDSVSENRKVRGIFSTFLKWFILTTFGIS